MLQTADRALRVLLAFRDRPDWGVTELAEALQLDKSVTHRLLATLAVRGFVVADPDSRRYRLGPTVGVLARAAERGGALEASARPLLADAAKEAGESALLAVPQGFGYRCAVAVDADGPIRYTAIVGDVLPGHGGASGHAIFAFYPEDEIRGLCGSPTLPRFTDTTVTRLDSLLELYAKVRQDGASVSWGEYDESVSGVAAPVFAASAVVGSLTLIGPAERMSGKIDQCVHLVREAAATLSTSLGVEEYT